MSKWVVHRRRGWAHGPVRGYGTIRRVLFRFLAVVIGAVLLAGCTSGGGAKPSRTPSAPTTSVSVSVSPSAPRTGPLTTGPGVRPGEKPPTLPEAARKHDQSGALVFVGYYFSALDWSLATSDPYLLETISAPQCGACQRHIESIRGLREQGGHVEGGRSHALSFRAVTGSFKVTAEHVIEAKLRQDAYTIVESNGSTRSSQPAHESSVLVFVTWSGGWRVVEVGSV